MNHLVILNQRVLARWRDSIDSIDAIIIAHIERLVRSRNEKVASRRIVGEYSWVDLNSILRDNPIIGIEYRQLKRRVAKLVHGGILERKTRMENSRKRSYFKLSDEWDYWVEFWKEHDGEEPAHVYGWVSMQGSSMTSVDDTGVTGDPKIGSSMPHVPGSPESQDSSVLLSGKPVGSKAVSTEAVEADFVPPKSNPDSTLAGNKDARIDRASELSPVADDLIDYLNAKTIRSFKKTENNRIWIRARLLDDMTVADLKRVVDDRVPSAIVRGKPA
jgi:hypothetical protein